MLAHIAHVEYQQQHYWGFVDGDTLQIIEEKYSSTADIMQARHELLALTENERAKLKHVKLKELKVLSPITGQPRVICQGANYRQHMIESGIDPDRKDFNMFFNKSSASLCSASDDIIKPKHVSLLDYEIELGLVIAKTLDTELNPSEAKLSDYIGGLVIANDVSARDIQIPQTQFFKGKSYRTFCPTGPYLCLINEQSIHYLDNLTLELRVNEVIRQQDNTQNLVFKALETLVELSTFSDLSAGDLLLTGTPCGCALQIPSPGIVKLFHLLPETMRWRLFKHKQAKNTDYLKVGDQIKARIYHSDRLLDLGLQHNHVSSHTL